VDGVLPLSCSRDGGVRTLRMRCAQPLGCMAWASPPMAELMFGLTRSEAVARASLGEVEHQWAGAVS
jgi:hypothetical protein